MDKQIAPQPSMIDRLEHFTWAWFCLPMSTGGVALLLSPSTQPHAFPGLDTIGKLVYILDLVLFTLVLVAISIRFIRWPGTLKASLTHPTESLFAATSLLSTASIIAAIARYGIPSCGPWLVTVFRILFWIYFAVTFLWAISAYMLLFTSPALKIQDMTPAYDLPIFPFMLSGTIAASGAHLQPPDHAVPVIVAGVMAQGLGFIMSILMYALYIRRMVQFGFPGPIGRPAMFIAVGPPSFTALALLGMADGWPREYMNYFGDNIFPGDVLGTETQQLIAIQILRTMATFVAVFIWSLSLWFFCIAVGACLMAAREMSFHLNWWAFVFPNVGFAIATISIGKVFKSDGIKWVGSVMTIVLVVTWLVVAGLHVRAVLRKDILWPGKDEDVYAQVGQGKKEKSENDVEKQD